MTGAERIAAERQRQIDVEGYDAEHDDAYQGSHLVDAAICYARNASWKHEEAEWDMLPPPGWPWSSSFWKPSEDPIRDLERAGALIAAEIDRLLRAKEKGGAS